MIYHQSPYGHIIKFPSELYYALTDEELARIEERYLNVDICTISYSYSEQIDIDTIIDGNISSTNFSSSDED